MYRSKSIAVVVPCKNEAAQIGQVIETMPAMVDAIVIIDDGSTDGMARVVRDAAESDPRIRLIRHEKSRGVGGAIAAGYVWARDEGIDITVVMAGDGQMDPADFERVVYPVAREMADYCKGNRFKYPDGLRRIPPVRKFGNFVLSTLTKIASGYWHISDTQTGYTAINRVALSEIDAEHIYPSYGCPNDILIRLNVADMRVAEVPINPLYHVGEQSKMRVPRVMVPILRLLFKRFVWRIVYKYVIMNGHPVVFSYLLSALFLASSVGLCLWVIVKRLQIGEIGLAALVSAGVALIVGLQSLVTAFWMDADANRNLCVQILPGRIEHLLPRRRPARPSVAERPTSPSRPLPEIEVVSESTPAETGASAP